MLLIYNLFMCLLSPQCVSVPVSQAKCCNMHSLFSIFCPAGIPAVTADTSPLTLHLSNPHKYAYINAHLSQNSMLPLIKNIF